MLLKFYRKSEIWFAVAVIVVYVLVMGNLQANFGTGSICSAAGMLIIVGILCLFIFRNGLKEKYALVKVNRWRECLYFIPLLLLASVNLWCGMSFHYDFLHQAMAVVTMLLSGVAEEIIFRGLLYRAIEKDSRIQAILISSLTFGAGHIVNLLTGGGNLETILQIFYAIAIGFSFAMVLHRSGSLLPCILTHCAINVTAEFSVEGSQTLMYVQVAFLILVAGGYALFLGKNSKSKNEPEKNYSGEN